MTDRTGYTITEQHADDPSVQTTWAIKRDEDGVGLGAYASQDGVDVAIAQDRATAEQRQMNEPVIDRPTKTVLADEPEPMPDGTRVDA